MDTSVAFALRAALPGTPGAYRGGLRAYLLPEAGQGPGEGALTGPVCAESPSAGRYSSSSAYEPMASAMSAWAQNRWYVNVGAAPPAK